MGYCPNSQTPITETPLTPPLLSLLSKLPNSSTPKLPNS